MSRRMAFLHLPPIRWLTSFYNPPIKTGNTFKIIRENMFNQKDPVTDTIQGQTIYYGESSYIITVRWADFIDDVDTYFDCAMNLKENRIDEYELQKQP